MSAGTLLPAAARLVTGRAAAGGGVVLCYHDVVGGGEEPRELDVTVDRLRHHLTLTRRLGYRFVSLAELSLRAGSGGSLEGLAAVAFDDALSGVARHAAPVLAELRVPATLFALSTGWGRRPAWWAGAGPTMTRAELQQSLEAGLTLAAHSRTHASLPLLTGPALHDEVAGSRAELEDVAGAAVDLFAYPFGHHDPHVRDSVRVAGFRAAYTFLNGRLTGSEDPLRLPRFTMGRHHDRLRLAYHLARPPRSWPDHQLDQQVDGQVDGAGP